MRSRAFFLGIVLLVLAPSASAERATLRMESAEPVQLQGTVEAHAPGGVVRINAPDAEDAYLFEGAVGRLVLYTWRTASVPSSPERVATPIESAERASFRLNGTLVRLDLRDEPVALTAVASNGTVRIRGDASGAGFPVALSRRVDGVVSTPAVWPFKPAENVPWTWERGWLLVGRFPPDAGFPHLGASVIGLEGGFALQLRGGNVTFVDDAGEAHAFRLGNWTESKAASAGAVVEVQVQRRLVFEGALASARVAPAGAWGVAAPAMSWDVEGAAAWRDATGWAQTSHGRAEFANVPVHAEGRFTVIPDVVPDVPSVLSPVAYAAGGDFTRLDVAGVPRAASPATGVAERTTFLSLVVGVLFAFSETGRGVAARVLAIGYTRIAREDLLAHATRRRIFETVTASPGCHMGELRRAVGLAWGAFAFHFHALETGGYVRSVRMGRYLLVHPAGTEAEAVLSSAIPNLVARRIYDILPQDGSSLPMKDLQRAAAVSRQLLRYHVRCLAERGLVRVASGRGRLHVWRVQPTADAPKGARPGGQSAT